MNINSLKYFVKACKDKNFTKSSKDLFITQQAFSRIISNLEKELSTPLFKRNSRGVELTQIGEYIYPKADKLINEFKDFEDDINEKIQFKKKKLHIGFAPGTLRTLGSKYIVEFSKEFLNIDIVIHEYTDIACEANVLNGSIDMACTINPRNTIDFSYYNLKKDYLVAVVNKNNPIAKKQSINFTDLRNEKLILLDETFRIQSLIMENFIEAGFEPDILVKCTFDLLIAYDFVALNKGVFIFVNCLANTGAYDEICCVKIKTPTAMWDIGFLVKKDIIINKNMKIFMNYFLNRNNQKIII
ncbi:LysR family transcriptional regulator [Clostridium estertheticum]|uniref:LysR family transcriptional regulator n=1 Tax=Clostridium estertheticum TaxID=238834 RepID=A0AA47I6M6_9CLOT|nr:LysR family transcriptional regulator [Clostridium estertheticum]MBU3155628.1 LysR family transcriptional regulator [Clostridium estertheticum]MBU3198151.1 LysR family transcriptional regulator [Clostridium estertheticum]WAG59980.1 LysR family transcriptional regulator [Clostridium estertheticum]WAG65942.1 LysR family transcriptional regulator [Clostridium estertheticum]